MPIECGALADRTIEWRSLRRYPPELEKRLRSRLKPANMSWRVDETYMRVNGKWTCLFPAVDSTGAAIDVVPPAHRGPAAAQRFFQKALHSGGHPAPRTINVDKNPCHPVRGSGIEAGRASAPALSITPSAILEQYLAQDHRAIKRRVKASQGFRFFWAAQRTIAGCETPGTKLPKKLNRNANSRYRNPGDQSQTESLLVPWKIF